MAVKVLGLTLVIDMPVAGDVHRPLATRSRARSERLFRLVGAVRTEREAPIAFEVQATEDGLVDLLHCDRVARREILALEEQSVVDLDGAAAEGELTPSKDGVPVVLAVIKDHRLVLDIPVGAFGHFSAPVVARINTVAEAGPAASGAGGGQVA